MEEKRPAGLSGFTLKMIALITMLIDHTGASVVERLYTMTDTFAADMSAGYHFYYLLRSIGRMAFPIYCFLLVEGFVYTRSRWKYAARLAVFALLSELPFDLALFGSWFDREHNNVFFTLLIGLLTLMAMEWAEEYFGQEKENRLLMVLAQLAILTVMCLTAEFLLCTDYGMIGVMAIVILYRWRGQKELAFALAVLLLGVGSSPLEFWALLMLIPIHFYNGSRGRQLNKYLFYAFYPLHLTLLALICQALGLGV